MEHKDIWDDPQLQAYLRRARNELVPMLESCRFSVSVLPEGEPDVKFALELGLSILLGKPIIAVVRPGVKVPEKLVLVADRIVEGDMATKAGTAALAAAIRVAVEELEREAGR